MPKKQDGGVFELRNGVTRASCPIGFPLGLSPSKYARVKRLFEVKIPQCALRSVESRTGKAQGDTRDKFVKGA